MSVGMAFDYFKEKVDIAIIEVGMGGRLDNNIITPLVSVITNIGLDHTISRKYN
jgi:dihydrofolate synthase/folylpolyglutamate synthase